jgi:hypothetical protein
MSLFRAAPASCVPHFYFFRYNLTMYLPHYLEPVDYLVIGHLTKDLTPDGPRLGGTAAYAALTARALGLRVGVVTSWAADLHVEEFEQIPVVNLPDEHTTTFENIPTPEGRLQKIHQVASNIDLFAIPEVWRSPSIVHIGPVAQEVEPGLLRHFSNSLIGVTPQGWLRGWDESGWVHSVEWPEARYVLSQAGAAVISAQDVGEDEDRIDELATCCRILAVTEEEKGSRIYWHGDVRRFLPPEVEVVDDVGAGDVFATAFFVRLLTTRDPWEAARFATQLASISITRPGLSGIPTPQEIEECMIEVF